MSRWHSLPGSLSARHALKSTPARFCSMPASGGRASPTAPHLARQWAIHHRHTPNQAPLAWGPGQMLTPRPGLGHKHFCV